MKMEEVKGQVQKFLELLDGTPEIAMQIKGKSPQGYPITITIGPMMENRLILYVQLHKGAGVAVTDEEMKETTGLLHYLIGREPTAMHRTESEELFKARVRAVGGGVG